MRLVTRAAPEPRALVPVVAGTDTHGKRVIFTDAHDAPWYRDWRAVGQPWNDKHDITWVALVPEATWYERTLAGDSFHSEDFTHVPADAVWLE